MEFDYQQPSIVGGVVTYPDFPFGNLPTPPGNIKETVVFQGQYQTTISMVGSVDSNE